MQFLRNNSLSISMFSLFAIFLAGLSVSGYLHQNNELTAHQQPTQTYGTYIRSGEFVEAVFENWESEFLQMGALVICTIFLRQRGSADSKKLRGKETVDTGSRYSIIRASTAAGKRKALLRQIYSHSLGLSLFALFLLSFALHAVGGASAQGREAELHHEHRPSVMQYVTSSQFWFESFQNWQSEFLAVGTLLVLSIFLRERGSPESKPIGAANSKTGE